MDIFPLKNADGKNSGNLQISMRWKHPFRKSRELGPRSISGSEVEALIAAFSSGEMSEGLISYKDFCRFIDPPRDVLRTMDKLRTYATKMLEKENIKSTDLYRILFDFKADEETIKEDSFTQVSPSGNILTCSTCLLYILAIYCTYVLPLRATTGISIAPFSTLSVYIIAPIHLHSLIMIKRISLSDYNNKNNNRSRRINMTTTIIKSLHPSLDYFICLHRNC